MAITVRVVQGAEPGPPRIFSGPVVRVGREQDNDVVLSGPNAGTVSRHHAELRFSSGEWRVVDVSSTHGTYLRGQRVTDAVLREGDEIRVGPDGQRLLVSLSAASADVAPSGATRTTGGATGTTGARQDPSESELLPIKMGSAPIAARGYLVPGLVTAGALSAVLYSFSSGDLKLTLSIMFLFFVGASTYVLYLLCGKPKSLWALVGAALLVGL